MIILLCIFQLQLLHQLVLAAENKESQFVHSCEQKLRINDTLSRCARETSKRWHCILIIEENVSNSQWPLVQLNCGPSEPMFCCPMWSVMECLLHQANRLCHHNYHDWLLTQISKVQHELCANYMFNASACKNMFHFVSNTKLLESAAKNLDLENFVNQPNESHLIDFGTRKPEHQFSKLYWLEAVIVLAIIILVVSITLVTMNVWKDFI